MAFPAGCYPRSQKPLSAPFVGVLDGLTGLTGAYSQSRRLLSAFTGDVKTVRRAAGGSQGISSLSTGWLDIPAMESFCAGDDGFCSVLTDQAGIVGDLAIGTASLQPQVVSAGSAILGGTSRATAQWDGVDDGLLSGGIVYTEYSFVVSAKLIAPGFFDMLVILKDGAVELREAWSLDSYQMIYEATASDSLDAPAYSASSWRVISGVFSQSNGTVKLYVDGNLVVSKTGVSVVATEHIHLGRRVHWGPYSFNGFISELAIFNTAVSDADRIQVETAFMEAVS